MLMPEGEAEVAIEGAIYSTVQRVKAAGVEVGKCY